jgi:RNA polymerase sigma-70 factor (ECF subfamily)
VASSLPSVWLETAPEALRPAGKSWYGSRMQRGERARPFGDELLAHADALYHFARNLTRADDAARELVQDTFVRALGAQGSFVAGSNLKAWLFRILHNAFVDRHRRTSKSPLELRDDTLDGAPEDAGDVWLRGDIELERLRRLVADDIRAALAELSLEARTVILLDVEGFTETEIARVMDSAIGTVKSRLIRARAKLRVLLGDYAR